MRTLKACLGRLLFSELAAMATKANGGRAVQQRMLKRILICETSPVHVKKGPELIGLVESVDLQM